MTKREVKMIFDVAAQLKATAFSKLGLSAAKFLRVFQDEYADLSDEHYFVSVEFALKDEKGQVVRNQQGTITFDSKLDKEKVKALKDWGKEEFEIDWSKFSPISLEGKLLFMSAEVYEILNGYVFDVEESIYLEALEAEIVRQDALNESSKNSPK